MGAGAPGRARHAPAHEQRHAVLFSLLTLVFVAIAVLDDRSTLVQSFDRMTRAAPILFFSVAVYFENRFEFYDLVIKRGVILVATIAALGLLMLAQPVLDGLPAGPVRPWLAALVLVPAAMVLPWLSRALSAAARPRCGSAASSRGRSRQAPARRHAAGDRRADAGARGRAAVDRRSSTRRSRVRLDAGRRRPARRVLVEAVHPIRTPLHFEVPRDGGAGCSARTSQMLRSLASVFGFMLETCGCSTSGRSRSWCPASCACRRAARS
jgi:hypothetical protein